ncbi:hypothetical protein B0T11DRAFT_297148 [Plectosphaerella cucumerina]|uniref:Uncharacterized protein n=1 Tax=Plectosphaerella cucumerina TaxID=40658 RepID=A0A8K0TFL3_9PEZI|nr:hypothetical protein B0T11DRAFT_297148 [Plectosphaerella cucumerina]
MRVSFLFMGLLALLRPVRAETTALHAAILLHVYVNYDFDIAVNGVGKNTIAQWCRGSGENKRCTFDEFVNYIQSGAATASPSYFEYSSGFSFFTGDVAAIIDALRRIATYQGEDYRVERFVKGRKSAIGIFHDLSRIADANFKAADNKGMQYGVRRQNIKESLRAVSYYASVSAQEGIVDRIKAINGILLKTSERSHEYAKGRNNRIDWREIVNANPDLKDRNSELYKTVASTIRGQTNERASMYTQSVANNVAAVLASCHK